MEPDLMEDMTKPVTPTAAIACRTCRNWRDWHAWASGDSDTLYSHCLIRNYREGWGNLRYSPAEPEEWCEQWGERDADVRDE